MRWLWQKKSEPKIGRLAKLIGELLNAEYADRWSWDGFWLRHDTGELNLWVSKYNGLQVSSSDESLLTDEEQEWLRPKIEEVLAVARPRSAAIMLARVERLVAEVRAGVRASVRG